MGITKKQIILPFIFLGVGVLGFVILQMTKAPAEKKDDVKAVPFVAVEPADMVPMQLSAASQGEVSPRYATRLVSQVSGLVVTTTANFVNGGIVKKGDLLVQIDPFDYQVRLQQANAELASARAAFIQERAQGRVAEAEWATISNAAPSELGLRKPQQEQALAAVKAAEASLTQAQKDLERTEIRAPFDGLIKMRSVSPGHFVNVGGEVGEIMDISVAEIRLPVNQHDFAFLLNMGRDADVTLSGTAYGQPQQWQARIVRDEGMVDSDSRMIYLVAQVDDPYGMQSNQPRLPFGTYVSADIKGETITAARIPRRLFINNRLPIVEDNKLVMSSVKQIRQDGKFTIVTEGLDVGDLILISALDAPVDGMEVKWQEDKDSDSLAESVVSEIESTHHSVNGVN